MYWFRHDSCIDVLAGSESTRVSPSLSTFHRSDDTTDLSRLVTLLTSSWHPALRPTHCESCTAINSRSTLQEEHTKLQYRPHPMRGAREALSRRWSRAECWYYYYNTTNFYTTTLYLLLTLKQSFPFTLEVNYRQIDREKEKERDRER